MIEDVTSNDLNSKQMTLKNKKSSFISNAEQMSRFDPLSELDLQVDLKDKEDVQQLTDLLINYLHYPSSEIAEVHNQAQRLGNYDIDKKTISTVDTQASEIANESFCPCCAFIKQEDDLKVCTAFSDVNNIGTSTHLYFKTFKGIALLLVILMLVYCVYALVTNQIATNNATGSSSLKIDYLSISLSSKQQNATDSNNFAYYVQCWLGVAVVAVWLIIFQAIKYYQLKDSLEYDSETVSASDFTIVMEQMPMEVSRAHLQSQFDSYFEGIKNIPANMKRPLKIAKYNVGKPFYFSEEQLADEESQALEKSIQELRQEFIAWVQERQSSPRFLTTKDQRQQKYQAFQKLLQQKNKKIQHLAEKLKAAVKESNQQKTTVFVTFETNLARIMITELNRSDIYSKLRYYLTCCQDSNRFYLQKDSQYFNINIERAPEPEDIKWENIGLTTSRTFCRKLFTFSVTTMLLGICFGIVYGLSTAQQQYVSNRYISGLISILISVVNIILGQVICRLTLFEKDYTETNHQTSLAIKSVIAQMVNSILIPIIANRFIKDNIYTTNGLADDIFLLGITNSFVSPILKIFDPYYYFVKIRACLKLRPASKLNQNQKSLNSFQERMLFQVGYEYIYLVNLFLFVCYFVSLQPIIVVFALMGMLLMYWSQKFSLFNRYRRPVPGSDLINTAMYQLIFLGPLMYALGSLTWANFFPEGTPKYALIPNLVALGIGVLTFLIPSSLIVQCCMKQNIVEKDSEFDESRIFFSSEYDRLNPATYEEGMKDYEKYVERKKDEIKSKSKEDQDMIAQRLMNNAKRGVSQYQHPTGTFNAHLSNIQPYMLMPQPVNQPFFMASQFMPNMYPQQMNRPFPMQQQISSMPVMQPQLMRPQMMQPQLNMFAPQPIFNQPINNGFHQPMANVQFYPNVNMGYGPSINAYGQPYFGGAVRPW